MIAFDMNDHTVLTATTSYLHLSPLPATFRSTREAVQRVATHILARRRHALCGKFGLRATPGGAGTPACGPDHEIVRIAGSHLLHERTGPDAVTATLDLATATLADAAALVGVDVTAPFEAGQDTPPVGDPTECLAIDPEAASVLAEWFRYGWAVLDTVVGTLGPDGAPSVVQLWPEHFDAGVDVAYAPGSRVNLGASPGDGFSAQPYLYVGPWDSARPSDPSYWNAPFGAVLPYDELHDLDTLAAQHVVVFGGRNRLDGVMHAAHRRVEALTAGGRFDQCLGRGTPGECAVASQWTVRDEEGTRPSSHCGTRSGEASGTAAHDDEVVVGGSTADGSPHGRPLSGTARWETSRSSAARLVTPMLRPTSLPSGPNTTSVGMLMICNKVAVSGLSSTLQLPNRTPSPLSRATAWNVGANSRHGPHQGAQKSTIV